MEYFKQFSNQFYKYQGLIYKVFLFALSTFLIVYFFPKGAQFKYDFTKNQVWQYDDYYAPFSFALYKSDQQIEDEKKEIESNHIPYFKVDIGIWNEFDKKLQNAKSTIPDSILPSKQDEIFNFAKAYFDEVYQVGVIDNEKQFNNNQLVFLKKGNLVTETLYGQFSQRKNVKRNYRSQIENSNLKEFEEVLIDLIEEYPANISFDKSFTQRKLDKKFDEISYTEGLVKEGEKIINNGELIDADKYKKLDSLREEFKRKNISQNQYLFVSLGYSLLVALALLMLLLFIKLYRPNIYENNNKLTFIFFNILLVVGLTLLVMEFSNDYIYVVPICILPLTLKVFFDARLGLFTHVITLLILGFVVPNSYEYMFLHIIAGIVTILTVSELYKRANLFLAVGRITLIYFFAYLAFNLIQEASFQQIAFENLIYFAINGIGLLFIQPLIYGYEKAFGLISDLSLLELSDTNSKLLKRLSEVAPGTFHHSLNVANLAEASANEVQANSLLVRVGALYHDLGKMKNPYYFTENQSTSVNPHDEISPKESAKIIIDHRINGIEIAKKHNLPDRIIDFIRTHHGTSTVYFFYAKAKKESEDEVKREDFQYPGPIPFSKETAILMMCDAVEAASKSLKEPTAKIVDQFVEKIIDKQIEEKQFLNADITFKEIEVIKKVLKAKLKNIFHLRIEYPE
ncbi:HD family phosphohydrolase [Psychroflexus planctonicus]|uniref:HDIG domain-containing protein n=1 Tax=Psychroflexus planctonicus TaxID=1526575 RepID=A0ABQ1SDT7_9FLAO|nr:HDIG domain-containing metalloprotein [Psychroflexus planctonicus]GGE31268.1 HDIG domain-containing protein [Psychroflexus planctonicus]